jgi:hypothetical protein
LDVFNVIKNLISYFWCFLGAVRTAQRLKKKKQLGQHNSFSTTPNLFLFFSLEGTTLFHLLQKIQKTHSCFWWHESLPKLSKNPFQDFGPLGVKFHCLEKKGCFLEALAFGDK